MQVADKPCIAELFKAALEVRLNVEDGRLVHFPFHKTCRYHRFVSAPRGPGAFQEESHLTQQDPSWTAMSQQRGSWRPVICIKSVSLGTPEPEQDLEGRRKGAVSAEGGEYRLTVPLLSFPKKELIFGDTHGRRCPRSGC